MRALLLDLQGVLFEDNTPIPGAVATVAAARASGMILRFVTNTATRHHLQILADLRGMGFVIDEAELFTAPLATRNFLVRQGWTPHCLVHPAIVSVFTGLGDPDAANQTPDCVVLGDARDKLTYGALNQVFRFVMAGKPLIGIGMNRCFREGSEWMLDAGAFIHAIEWAARKDAIVMGKPSPTFFDELIASTGVPAHDCMMIGDDVEADVAGAMTRGIAGCLVRTGKFQNSDQSRLPRGAVLIDSIADWPSLMDQKT